MAATHQDWLFHILLWSTSQKRWIVYAVSNYINDIYISLDCYQRALPSGYWLIKESKDYSSTEDFPPPIK